MDKIIERAKEYADRHQDAELNHFGLGRTYGYQRIYNAELTAYERGAKEQKAIDDAELLKLKSAWEKQAQINHDDEANYQQGYHDAIEKARKWLEGYCCEIGCKYDCNFDDIMVDGPKRFRKAMEE